MANEIQGSAKSRRSQNLEAATKSVLAMLDAYSKIPRHNSHARAAQAVVQRMAGMSEEQRRSYDTASDAKREAWAAKAFREELARLETR